MSAGAVRTLAATTILSATLLAAAPGQAQQPGPSLTRVAGFDHQVTGVSVARDGRIFVNFPRWTDDAPVSVAEIRDGKAVPFPDERWNSWRNARKDELDPAQHFVCVQSVVVDAQDRLWVVDAAAPAMASVVKNGPKLVAIDLKTNRVVQTIPIDDTVALQGSYLNDIRISPDGRTAYLTDSGAKGALIVVDIPGGRARRVLDGHPTTQPDPKVTVQYDGKPLRRPDGRGVEFAADGIALSRDGATLYWQAIKGKDLFSIPTASLTGWITARVVPDSVTDSALAGDVKVVGENGPADGLLIGRADGRMYVTSPQDDSVKVRDLSQEGGAPSVLVKDQRLRWPDTFSEGPDGTIYVTASKIQDSAFFKEGAPISLPTELWSFKPGPSGL